MVDQELYNKLARGMRKKREEMGLSIEMLSEKAGVSVKDIINIENGELDLLDTQDFIDVCYALGSKVF